MFSSGCHGDSTTGSLSTTDPTLWHLLPPHSSSPITTATTIPPSGSTQSSSSSQTTGELRNCVLFVFALGSNICQELTTPFALAEACNHFFDLSNNIYVLNYIQKCWDDSSKLVLKIKRFFVMILNKIETEILQVFLQFEDVEFFATLFLLMYYFCLSFEEEDAAEMTTMKILFAGGDQMIAYTCFHEDQSRRRARHQAGGGANGHQAGEEGANGQPAGGGANGQQRCEFDKELLTVYSRRRQLNREEINRLNDLILHQTCFNPTEMIFANLTGT